MPRIRFILTYSWEAILCSGTALRVANTLINGVAASTSLCWYSSHGPSAGQFTEKSSPKRSRDATIFYTAAAPFDLLNTALAKPFPKQVAYMVEPKTFERVCTTLWPNRPKEILRYGTKCRKRSANTYSIRAFVHGFFRRRDRNRLDFRSQKVRQVTANKEDLGEADTACYICDDSVVSAQRGSCSGTA